MIKFVRATWLVTALAAASLGATNSFKSAVWTAAIWGSGAVWGSAAIWGTAAVWGFVCGDTAR